MMPPAQDKEGSSATADADAENDADGDNDGDNDVDGGLSTANSVSAGLS